MVEEEIKQWHEAMACPEFHQMPVFFPLNLPPCHCLGAFIFSVLNQIACKDNMERFCKMSLRFFLGGVSITSARRSKSSSGRAGS